MIYPTLLARRKTPIHPLPPSQGAPLPPSTFSHRSSMQILTPGGPLGVRFMPFDFGVTASQATL